MDRRTFIVGAATGAAITGGISAGIWWGHRPNFAPDVQSTASRSALPGDFPGRVVEVSHPGAVHNKIRDREVISRMLDRGLQSLVSAPTATDAWRHFFQTGDRVGIKVVPVGRPDSISSPEIVLEVIHGLQSAGVRLQDILVFDRYRDEFLACGYDKILPEGVHWECCSARYDDLQVELDGQQPNAPREKNVAGYDRDHFMELNYCTGQHDPSDDRRLRSHVSTIITRKVDKFVSIPVLKDHRSSGVTLSLKNLSHGSVNNVARSHMSSWLPRSGQPYAPGLTLNQCGTFIPAAVSLPIIKEKAVLQILDGLIGTWEGGPGTWNQTFATWEYGSIFLATDPVALDHVGWTIIDAKRGTEGWPSVAKMGLEGEHRMLMVDGFETPSEQFHIRQPEHIPLAGACGLGTFDLTKITHDRIQL